jgi:hypothetical protein
MLYAQVFCLQSETELNSKFRLGLFLSFVYILQAIAIIYTVETLKERASE